MGFFWLAPWPRKDIPSLRSSAFPRCSPRCMHSWFRKPGWLRTRNRVIQVVFEVSLIFQVGNVQMSMSVGGGRRFSISVPRDLNDLVFHLLSRGCRPGFGRVYFLRAGRIGLYCLCPGVSSSCLHVVLTESQSVNVTSSELKIGSVPLFLGQSVHTCSG